MAFMISDKYVKLEPFGKIRIMRKGKWRQFRLVPRWWFWFGPLLCGLIACAIFVIGIVCLLIIWPV